MITTNFSFRLTFVVPLALLVSLQTSSSPLVPQQDGGAIALRPCEVSGIQGTAKCGKFEVFENRATRKGRKISLNILVLPATGEKRESDPLFYFAGGPGSGATEEAPGIAQAFARIREHRDLVFVDQRGTGQSHQLDCNFYNPNDQQSYLGYFFPLEDVRKCRSELESKAELTLYTTTIAMDDIDEVRAALGYDKINLFGASYGTRAAMVYLRQHPKHVRTVMLQGVSPTNMYLPGDYPQQTERALQGVLADCAADEACNKAFPNLKSEAKAVLERLLKGPVDVELRMPNAAAPLKVSLSRNLAAEAVRYMLYSPAGAARLPLLLHQAAAGDFGPLAQNALRFRRTLVGTGSNGMYLTVTCAEDVPWVKSGEGERIAQNTFLGDYRLQQQREACALWPRARIDSDYFKPVRSDVPVFIFTGEWDPVTPPANGDFVARTFPNSLHVVVPHGGHGLSGLEGLDCIERLVTEYVERGTAKGLDTACVKNIHRRGFALK
ncbi:MAG TPA: alpha/beta hydrolase [Pyrinomonadaceae bacterium]|nr:alpha/beta hydrolase [Pyrinomonadaceae bacterium]